MQKQIRTVQDLQGVLSNVKSGDYLSLAVVDLSRNQRKIARVDRAWNGLMVHPRCRDGAERVGGLVGAAPGALRVGQRLSTRGAAVGRRRPR